MPVSEYRREYMRRWRAERAEHLQAYQQAYRATHPKVPASPAQRAARAAHERERRAQDPEAYRTYKRAYDAAHRSAAKRHNRGAQEARQAVLRDIRAAAGCKLCGLRDPEALHFHHRDRATKQFSIGQTAFRRGLAEVMAEIAKCDVLCADCHHAQHRNRRYAGWSRDHAACVQCGTTERRHEGHGLCYQCSYHAKKG